MIKEKSTCDMFKYEKIAYKKNYKIIAGIDEAGRGPLSGPVVASAVILPLNFNLKGINDSKKLTPKIRTDLFFKIIDHALDVGIAYEDNETIDKINILRATLRAMKRAVLFLKLKPDILFIDGDKMVDLPIKQFTKKGGDSLSVSIACASIISKVTRDSIMMYYDKLYPQYKFYKHKGYGTKMHFELLKKYGPCKIHRRSFLPVKEVLDKFCGA